MKTTHTPRPWTYRDGSECTFSVVAVFDAHPYTIPRSYEPIAEIPTPEHEGRGYEEGAANARLIAAAPDLLEQLRLAVAAHDEIVNSSLPALVKAAFAAKFNGEAARAAIAQATEEAL